MVKRVHTLVSLKHLKDINMLWMAWNNTFFAFTISNLAIIDSFLMMKANICAIFPSIHNQIQMITERIWACSEKEQHNPRIVFNKAILQTFQFILFFPSSSKKCNLDQLARGNVIGAVWKLLHNERCVKSRYETKIYRYSMLFQLVTLIHT